MNALHTGNVAVDMAVAMLLPVVLGAVVSTMQNGNTTLSMLWHRVRTRNQVTRTITHTCKRNQYGWTIYTSGDDQLLIKALMLFIAKTVAKPKEPIKLATFTLTELSKREQKKLGDEARSHEDDEYDSDDDYGPAARLRTLEVSSMPSDGDWIDAGDGVQVMRTMSRGEEGEKEQFQTETMSVTIRCKESSADERIQALVDRAYTWYKERLECEKDEQRYMFMMLHGPSAGGSDGSDGGPAKRLYKRYQLSDEKTFESLFFPDKDGLLFLLDHFKAKSGKFAIKGFPHKLGLLLYGPPGTGKTSLIKAIAHYTKRHIVSVPLAKIRTNQELMDVMFDKAFTCVNTAKRSQDDEAELPMVLDFKHVIFVMEARPAAARTMAQASCAHHATRQPRAQGNAPSQPAAPSIAFALSHSAPSPSRSCVSACGLVGRTSTLLPRWCSGGRRKGASSPPTSRRPPQPRR